VWEVGRGKETACFCIRAECSVRCMLKDPLTRSNLFIIYAVLNNCMVYKYEKEGKINVIYHVSPKTKGEKN